MRSAAPYSSTDSAKSVTSYENQRYRACGLNLNPLVAAIILPVGHFADPRSR